ncbi:hypothetical protein ABT278_15625 [Streptomyces sp. NPDC001228]|uniref:hypothetical protein n=1 Tax=Streptomyces sp. NPDC001228 TaxID=3154381 RepID=UPI00331F4B24
MITRLDEEPEFDGPDDPLTVVLRPPAAHLGPPPGRYEEIRRAAGRRRLLRVAAGAGATCAVALLIALPMRLTAPSAPVTPQVPLAPSAGRPTASHRVPASPAPSARPPRPSVTPERSRAARDPGRTPSSTPSAARVSPSELRGTPADGRRTAAATRSRS